MPSVLLSVWDKTGIVDFASELIERGWDLIASGGTAKALTEAGLAVQSVSSLTGMEDMLGGRVKTLHPAIHSAILARDTEGDMQVLAEKGWRPIEMVVVNLYPFEKVASQSDVDLETVIENIDIGGVALLRAAAKNFQRVTVLCEPEDYDSALVTQDPEEFRFRMAKKAFMKTTAYDRAIVDYFQQGQGLSAPLDLSFYPTLKMRYGENPHQMAAFYSPHPTGGPLGGELLQGKALSYNNILDLDAAWRAVISFEDPSVVIVKHLSPCGIASSPRVADAVRLAIASDPTSAFGSVIACNREVQEDFVESLGDLFVECLVAPGFSVETQNALENSQNLRLLEMASLEVGEEFEFHSVVGGLVRQSLDQGDPEESTNWQVVSRRPPSEKEMRELQFAWKACQPVKSNAILLARSQEEDFFTVGIGGGQPNRVDCVRIAGERAGARAAGSVLASDAFFPFSDGVEVAVGLGVTAIIQPGGSKGDPEVIECADAAGIAMIFTGVRHFRH
jgi:phosphoribosylaminoimidazolecarboxamide formyltransferase/IMP cyclohydrolase